MAVMDEDGLQHVHLEMEEKNVALFGLDRLTSYIPLLVFLFGYLMKLMLIAETVVGVSGRWCGRYPNFKFFVKLVLKYVYIFFNSCNVRAQILNYLIFAPPKNIHV